MSENRVLCRIFRISAVFSLGKRVYIPDRRYIFPPACIKYEKSMKNILRKYYAAAGSAPHAGKPKDRAAQVERCVKKNACQNVEAGSGRNGSRLREIWTIWTTAFNGLSGGRCGMGLRGRKRPEPCGGKSGCARLPDAGSDADTGDKLQQQRGNDPFEKRRGGR